MKEVTEKEMAAYLAIFNFTRETFPQRLIHTVRRAREREEGALLHADFQQRVTSEANGLVQRLFRSKARLLGRLKLRSAEVRALKRKLARASR